MPSHAETIIHRLQRDVFPWLGARPVGKITAPEILTVLRRIESRGMVDTAHRTHPNPWDGSSTTPSLPAERSATRRPISAVRYHRRSRSTTRPSQIPKPFGGLLRAIDCYQGSIVTQCALRLAPLTFVRPGELRQAEWSEINLEVGEWRIPGSRMKMRQVHIVPLSAQAVAILLDLHPLTGHGRFVFPGLRTPSRPMSENTVNAALRRLGYAKDEMTGHGFRSIRS